MSRLPCLYLYNALWGLRLSRKENISCNDGNCHKCEPKFCKARATRSVSIGSMAMMMGRKKQHNEGYFVVPQSKSRPQDFANRDPFHFFGSMLVLCQMYTLPLCSNSGNHCVRKQTAVCHGEIRKLQKKKQTRTRHQNGTRIWDHSLREPAHMVKCEPVMLVPGNTKWMFPDEKKNVHNC